MSRQSRLLSGFLTPIVVATICVSGALSQSAWEKNKIVSCQEDSDAHSLLLTTAKRVALPTPNVSYLPGDDGETIMVVDFAGLVWNLPPRVFRGQAPAGVHGIQEVRIGRFSESPPICRISITADSPRAFRAISFKTQPGSLALSWAGQFKTPAVAVSSAAKNRSLTASRYTPQNKETVAENSPLQSWSSSNLSRSELSAPDSSETPKPAPEIPRVRKSRNLIAEKNRMGELRPAILPRIELPSQTKDPKDPKDLKDAKNAKDTTVATLSPVVPPLAPDYDSPARTLRPPINPEDAERPIEIGIESNPLRRENGPEALKLVVKASHPFSYNTFRLHSPERYVIDFANCPELINAQLPDVSQNTFVRSLRIGQPDDDQKTRLVVDLTDVPISVKEESADGASRLGLTLLGGDQIDIKAAPATAAAVVPMPTNFSHLHFPSGTTVVLDAGHGGTDPGAQRGDVQEKSITMDIISKLKRVLEAKGVHIILTRADDTFVSLEDRVRITNATAPTLFLSVHINAMESASDIHGIETYYLTEQSRLLADAVHECLISSLAAPDRSVRKARFYVIKNTPVPAILAEVGFISNRDERDKLISSDYQMKIAEALEHGVILYLDRRLALKKSGSYTKTIESLPTDNVANAPGGTNLSGGRSNPANPKFQTTMQRIAQSKHRNSDGDLR